AIRTFIDPSVEFGLRFETHDENDDDEDEDDPDPEDDPPEPPHDAQIVQLDRFRKS
ncbi:MAG: hypothetical protein JNJ84_17450, partial [Rhodobacteraceae bacterium]|nr:hypothetical protein [Paracoccaceae bacterium]